MNTLVWGVKDSWVMMQRNTTRMFREPESLAIAIGLPVILMVLFVYVFGGAIDTGTAYINYVVPGIIITCVGYSSSMSASAVSQDMTGGLLQRLQTMPVRPVSLLFGQVAASFVRNIISATIVVLVAILIGFRPSASLLEWLGVAGLLLGFLFAFSWLGVVFGLLAKTPETAGAFSMIIMFLPYVSNAFVPTDTMPKWLAVFAEYQPLTPVIESLRALLVGSSAPVQHGSAVIWLVVIGGVSLAISMILYRMRAAR